MGNEGLRSLGVNYRRAVPVTKHINRPALASATDRSLVQLRAEVSLPYCGPSSLGRLDLMLAGFAPDDQPDLGVGRSAFGVIENPRPLPATR